MSRHIDPQRPGPRGCAAPHRRIGCRRVAALAILLGGIGPATGPAHSQAARTGRALGSRASIVLEEGRLVTASIQAASLEEVLQAFSEATGVTIQTSGGAGETVSIEFEQLPEYEALRAILGGRSSIGFYGDDVEAEAGSAPRLKRVWVLGGVASPATLSKRRVRSARTALPRRADPFTGLKRQALTDANPDRRRRAIERLVAVNDTKAKNTLVQALLNDKDDEVRKAALEQLLWYDDEAPRQPLIKAALKDSSVDVRRLALEEVFADQAEDDRGARRVLIQALADKEATIRVAVVEALGELDLEGAEAADLRRALVRATKDKDESVRLAAIEPLEDREMKQVLREIVAGDASPRVQQAASDALESLE